jgi:hypothetical protein
MIRRMTLLAYVWVGDAIMCMVDSKTTDSGPSASQESLHTIKSVTYPLDVAAQTGKSARAVLMVEGRNVFTPEVNKKPTGEPSATAIDIVAGALADLGPTYTDIGELGEAVWPALRTRMYDCSLCRTARDEQIELEEKDELEPDAPFNEREAGDCHYIGLHIAGFDGPDKRAVRYRRRWMDEPPYELAMQERAIYLSWYDNDYKDPPLAVGVPGEELDENSRVFEEMQSAYRTTIAVKPNLADTVGGCIRTTVLHRSGTSTKLPSWFL